MFKKVNPRQNFPELEDEVTKFWKSNNTFEKSIEQRDSDNRYVFYDGPPFITGTPHYGSLLPTIAKDVVPRYQAMNGKRVERQWGWDAHGLPIENKVEKQLKLNNRKDIEKFGVQNFVDACYEYTRGTSAEWKWYVDKIGRWVDFDNSYKTMDQDYMESVMWVFKQIYDKDLVYEGTRTSLYCTRCGTPVSNFEIAMDNSYADMKDPAVTIKFPITTEGDFKGLKILAWTTTPWTLPSNKALVVDPETTYVAIKVKNPGESVFSKEDETLIMAQPRVESVLEGVEFEIVKEFPGKDLLGLEYTPPFAYFDSGKNDHKIYEFPDMVHMAEGTGVVHSAIGFGEIDSQMGQKYKIQAFMSIDDEGKFIDQVTDYKGVYVKDADSLIVKDLTENGTLLKVETITHRYPFCYRCETPLIYKAQPSWYINIDKMRNDLLKNNENINWVPGYLKDGRFKKGIESAPDWGISRTRYWASPMPVWQRKEDGEVVERIVVGSRDELRTLSTTPITKITFVRNASRDKTTEDGEVNKQGWEQVEKLTTELKEHKFDVIFAGDTKRAKQTVDQIAVNNKVAVITNEIFGSLETRKTYDQIIKELIEKNEVASVSDLPETELISAFSQFIEEIKTALNKFLVDNVGKDILVATHAERLAFLRHIVEGRPLSETLGLRIGYTESITIFFNQDDLFDLHRPKIDNIKLKGKTGELERVEEVLDVWLDSASMPYASKHYPFENKQILEDNFPADFIVEYIAQTRAWFYVMHVVSTALKNSNSFKNVITTGVLSGTDGRKMSKSYGNYPDPKGVLEDIGADALRLYMMGSKIMVGGDMDFNETTLKEQVKTFLLPLWNSYSYFVTYANIHNWEPSESLASNLRNQNTDPNAPEWDHIPFKEVHNHIDKWIVAKLQMTIRDVKIAMDDYNIPAAVREFPKFVDDLSRWYIRRSRDRFNAGDTEALETLYYVLVEFTKVIAPVTPFISEAIYQNLVSSSLKEQPESVHLCDFPHPDIKFMEDAGKLMLQMEAVRNVVALAQSVRMQNGLKVRQPLAELEVEADLEIQRDYDFENWMKELIMSEVNVKKVDEKHTLSERKGWILAEDDPNDTRINLDTNLTVELKREGLYREITRTIQNLRKKQGLQLGDQVVIDIATESLDMLTCLDLYAEKIKSTVDAQKLNIHKKGDESWKAVKVDGEQLLLNISRI